MVTRFMLDWTKDQRADLHAEMHLRPGGGVEYDVHEQERISLETSIRLQEDILQRARDRMREDRAIAFNRGLARAEFNINQPEIKP